LKKGKVADFIEGRRNNTLLQNLLQAFGRRKALKATTPSKKGAITKLPITLAHFLARTSYAKCLIHTREMGTK